MSSPNGIKFPKVRAQCLDKHIIQSKLRGVPAWKVWQAGRVKVKPMVFTHGFFPIDQSFYPIVVIKNHARKKKFVTWGHLAFCRYCILDGLVRSVYCHAMLVTCAVESHPSEHLKNLSQTNSTVDGQYSLWLYQHFQTMFENS